MSKYCGKYISKEMLKRKKRFLIYMLVFVDIVPYVSCFEINCNNIGALFEIFH